MSPGDHVVDLRPAAHPWRRYGVGVVTRVGTSVEVQWTGRPGPEPMWRHEAQRVLP